MSFLADSAEDRAHKAGDVEKANYRKFLVHFHVCVEVEGLDAEDAKALAELRIREAQARAEVCIDFESTEEV